jgi:hypothetical protein
MQIPADELRTSVDRLVVVYPTTAQVASRVCKTPSPRQLKCGSSSGENRENVSTTVRTRILLLIASWRPARTGLAKAWEPDCGDTDVADASAPAFGLLPRTFLAISPALRGLQAESAHAFPAFVEDQPVEL